MASSSSISNREGTGSFWPMEVLSFDLWAGLMCKAVSAQVIAGAWRRS
ncbi:hypothetical protein SAURM35S_00994 [Streptomyces aurantiogriseus]